MIRALILFLLVMPFSRAAEAATCVARSVTAFNQKAVLTPAQVAGISPDMTFPEILAKLGPPQADRGSGLYVYIWPVTDGRLFVVTTPDNCKVFHIGLSDQ